MASVDTNLELKVEKRIPEKRSSRKLKSLGKVPAVVYGSNIQHLYLSLPKNIAVKYSSRKFDNKILTLKSEDSKINGLKVLKKDMAFDCLSRNPIHIDFLALDMSKNVRVTVEIKFLGKAKGVKEEGGVFSALKRNIEVECLPKDIPHFFEIDISGLNMNESYHVSDIQIPKNIKLITGSGEALCSVSSAQQEEIKEPAAAAPDETEKTAETADKSPAESNNKAAAEKAKKT